MKLQLIYCVEPTAVDKIKRIAAQYKGFYPKVQPDVQPIENYEAQEVLFENIADMNRFIYKAFMACGYYFLVETIVYTAISH